MLLIVFFLGYNTLIKGRVGSVIKFLKTNCDKTDFNQLCAWNPKCLN